MHPGRGGAGGGGRGGGVGGVLRWWTVLMVPMTAWAYGRILFWGVQIQY